MTNFYNHVTSMAIKMQNMSLSPESAVPVTESLIGSGIFAYIRVDTKVVGTFWSQYIEEISFILIATLKLWQFSDSAGYTLFSEF